MLLSRVAAKGIRGILASSFAGMLLLAGAPTASAATVPTTPAASWTPWAACAGNAAANCASVRAITRTADGTVWLGGTFSQLRSPDGTQSVTRGNLAALLPDGSPAPLVRSHGFNGAIFALSTDGTSVFAGGTFTKVDGQGALRIARFNATNGNRMSFTSGVNGAVSALTVSAGRLYVGGRFTVVQGSARTNLAALRSTTGALDAAWLPRAEVIAADAYPNDNQHNNTAVRSIVAAPEGNRIYVAGDMDLLNGVARPVIGAVDPATGATDSTFVPSSSLNKTFQAFQVAAADAGGGVLVAAGGLSNKAFRLRLDGSLAWAVNTDGDVQAAAVIGGTAYLGGHFTQVCTNSCYDGSESDDSMRMHIAAFDDASTRNPLPDPTWAPSLGPTFSPYYYGVWTLQAIGGALHVGGVFNATVVDGVNVKQPKYVRFG